MNTQWPKLPLKLGRGGVIASHTKQGDVITYPCPNFDYRQVSNIRHTLVGNYIVDDSDVVGASPVGAAPATSSFFTQHLASRYYAKTTAGRHKKKKKKKRKNI